MTCLGVKAPPQSICFDNVKGSVERDPCLHQVIVSFG